VNLRDVGIGNVSTKLRPEIFMMGLIGGCLLHVQQAELALENAIDIVLDDKSTNVADQTESERRKTATLDAHERSEEKGLSGTVP
jgi:hypothetical protein